MLIQLQGLSIISNVSVSMDDIVSLEVNFSNKERSGIELSGSRTITLSPQDSDEALLKYDNIESDLVGTVIDFTAKAVTETYGSSSQHVYEASEITFLDGAQIDEQKVSLSGVGNIRKVNVIGDGSLVSVHLYSTEKIKGEMFEGGRDVLLSGNSAKFFASKADELIGHNLEFSAKATSAHKATHTGSVTYSNYTVTRNEIKWVNKEQAA